MVVQRAPLADMLPAESGTVVEILGGRGVYDRLRVLGIRPGVKVRKVSPAARRGPVVVQVGGSQVCLGFGVAYKVLVETNNEKTIADGES